jgi:hypothetical protein
MSRLFASALPSLGRARKLAQPPLRAKTNDRYILLFL